MLFLTIGSEPSTQMGVAPSGQGGCLKKDFNRDQQFFSPPVLSGGVVVSLLAGTMGARWTVGEGEIVAEVPPAPHGGHQAGDC